MRFYYCILRCNQMNRVQPNFLFGHCSVSEKLYSKNKLATGEANTRKLLLNESCLLDIKRHLESSPVVWQNISLSMSWRPANVISNAAIIMVFKCYQKNNQIDVRLHKEGNSSEGNELLKQTKYFLFELKARSCFFPSGLK